MEATPVYGAPTKMTRVISMCSIVLLSSTCFTLACGGPSEPSTTVKVINGEAVTDQGNFVFRSTVALLGSSETCSGTLLAPSVVMTAAHCFEGDSLSNLYGL